MAWTAPRTWVTGELVTATLLNAHLRDNLLETAPAKVTTAGDLVYATGAGELARLGAVSGYGLRSNDGGTAPQYDRAPFILDVSTSEVDCVNTSAETTLYDSPVITANKLGTLGCLRLTVGGDMLDNAAGVTTFVLSVKFGASGGPTTVCTSNLMAFGDDPSRHVWSLTILMLLAGAHNSQKWLAYGTIAGPGTNLYGTQTDITPLWSVNGYATSAIATDVDTILRVTVDWSDASSAASFRKHVAVLEWWR